MARLVMILGTALLAATPALHGQLCVSEKLLPDPVTAPTLRGFGYAVDLDGDLALVGAPQSESSCIPGAGIILALDPVSELWIESARLTPSTAGLRHPAGLAVAIDAGVAAVGVRGTATASGSVGMFRLDPIGAGWSEEAVLFSPGPAGDGYGKSLAIAGDLLLVGAPTGEGSAPNSGFVHVHRYDLGLGDWFAEAVLLASDGQEGDGFGLSAAIEGDLALVGAPNAGGIPDAGKAYLFRRLPGGTWVEEQVFAGVSASAGLGTSVALSEGKAFVGEPLGTGIAPWTGVVHVYIQGPGGVWIEEGPLMRPGGLPGDYLGSAVSADGDRVIAGAVRDDGAGPDAGSVSIFRFDPITAGWIEEQELVSVTAEVYERFGRAVAISGTRALVGTTRAVGVPLTGLLGPLDDGKVDTFILDIASGAWSPGVLSTLADGGDTDQYGVSVAISGDRALIGIRRSGPLAKEAGTARVYLRDPTTGDWDLEQVLIASDGGFGHWFGAAVDIEQDEILVGAPGARAVYSFRRDALTGVWQEVQKLVPTGPHNGSGFGGCLARHGDIAIIGAPGPSGGFVPPSPGFAVIFRREPATGSWIEEQQLFLTAADSPYGFGTFVATDGETCVVSAPYTLASGVIPSTSLYRFGVGSGEWILEHTFTEPAGAAGGGAVALIPDGEIALIGSVSTSTGGPFVSAHRRDPTSGTWQLEVELDGRGPIALDGEYAFIGDTDTVRVYRRDPSGVWIPLPSLLPPDGITSSGFPGAIAASADFAIVGVPGDDEACLPLNCSSCDAGAVHLFALATCVPPVEFIRGDADGNGVVDLADPVDTLAYLFAGGSADCLDILDSNDDGRADLADPIHGIQHLFTGGPAPPPPFPLCGEDTTHDALGCIAPPICP